MNYTITLTAIKDDSLGPFIYHVQEEEEWSGPDQAYAQAARAYVKKYRETHFPNLIEPNADLRNQIGKQFLVDVKQKFGEKHANYVKNEPWYTRALAIVTDPRPVSKTIVTEQDMYDMIHFYWWVLERVYFVKS